MNRKTVRPTYIYELFDPRDPDLAWYVGKGDEDRANLHWKRFSSTGAAQNANLRRWFCLLDASGVSAGVRFRESVGENWPERERFWIAHWRVRNPLLCNVADGGNAPPPEAVRLGAMVSGRIAVQTGQFAKLQTTEIRRLGGLASCKNLTQELRDAKSRAGRKRWSLHGNMATEEDCKAGALAQPRDAKSKGGRIGGVRVHELHPGMAEKNGHRLGSAYAAWVKENPEKARERSGRGGVAGCHIRWHVRRNVLRQGCSFCAALIARKSEGAAERTGEGGE